MERNVNIYQCSRTIKDLKTFLGSPGAEDTIVLEASNGSFSLLFPPRPLADSKGAQRSALAFIIPKTCAHYPRAMPLVKSSSTFMIEHCIASRRCK